MKKTENTTKRGGAGTLHLQYCKDAGAGEWLMAFVTYAVIDGKESAARAVIETAKGKYESILFDCPRRARAHVAARGFNIVID